MAVFVYALTVLLLYASLQLLRCRFRSGLKDIPGPFLASISNAWKVIAVCQGDMPRWNVAAHKKYGPVVRIGPQHVSVASPKAFSIVHASRQAFAKSDFYEVGAPNYRSGPLENLFSITDNNYHAALRKNIGGLYTKGAVQDLERNINSSVNLFMEKVAAFSQNKPATLDMSLWLHLFTYDCLGEVNVSKKLGFLETGGDVGGMIAAADRVFYMVGLFTQAPSLYCMMNLFRGMKPAEKAEPLLKFVFDEVDRRCDLRSDGSNSESGYQTDMLDKLLQLHEAHPDRVSLRELSAAIFINLQAGHDVMAITLRAIWYYLAHNPHVSRTLREEIKSIKESEGLSKVELLPYSKMNSSMPYLDAVIHETLRIHPNTGTIIERKVPSEGAYIDGYHLPGSTIVGVNAWVLHRDSSIFGEDVDAFRPERWLEASEEQKMEMKSHIFSFGAGAHTCIGKNIAMMQISKLVVEFWSRFDAVMENPNKPWKVHGSWVTKQTDMDMIVSPLD